MTANIIFDNVKAYDVKRFDVKLGQAFRIELNDAEEVRWFSDADRVLNIDASGPAAMVESKATGESEIQLQRADGVVLLSLKVSVYSERAATLNVSAGAAEPQ